MFLNIAYIVLIGAAVTVQWIGASTDTSVSYETFNNESSHSLIIEELPKKHESLENCFSFDLVPDEYEMFPNKTVYVSAYNKTYEEGHYLLIGNSIRICIPTDTSVSNETFDSQSSDSLLIEEELLKKHKSLESCFSFDLEPDEYEMFRNKTVFVSAYNKTYEEGHYLLIGNNIRICIPTDTSVSNETFDSQSSDSLIIEEELLKKHKSLESCFSFDLEPDEYEMFPNKTVYVSVYNKTYEEDHYLLIGDNIRICAPQEVFDEKPSSLSGTELHYISLIGIGVSMVFLMLHLVVFAVVPELHNLPGCNLASLCLSLFLSYVFMLLGVQSNVSENTFTCSAAAVLTQFFFLVSFLWMFVMAFVLFRSIVNATENFRVSVKGFKPKKYICNLLICWGIASIFVAATLIVDNTEGIDESYKPKFNEACWFKSKVSLLTFFAGPLFVIICVNFLLFGITAYNIFANRMKTQDSSNRAYLKKHYLTYLRLATIMGITWITGLLAPILDLLWLWYVFSVLNGFQGLFIFIAFTCTSKVKKYLKSNLLNLRRSSQQTLTTPTFQSYCFYANSIEKDLDKIVENKDKSNPIDTIVIHL